MLTQTRYALNITEKAAIAAVITWDSLGKLFTAEEVETIKMVENTLIVKLTGDRSYPIHKESFKAIRNQQLAIA